VAEPAARPGSQEPPWPRACDLTGSDANHATYRLLPSQLAVWLIMLVHVCNVVTIGHE
jgi:hypothetical protein